MAGRITDLRANLNELKDDYASVIVRKWEVWIQARQQIEESWKEIRNYVMATDTRSTSNAKNGWKNSTTTPQLCRIRDNLHANYLATLLPNDNYLRWQGDNPADQQKARVIEAYMRDKAHRSKLHNTISQLIYDYIDHGICFVTVEHVSEEFTQPNGRVVKGYSGPVACRISPYDIAFNPLAPSFAQAPKIIRSIRGIGELYQLAERFPNKWGPVVGKMMELRALASGYTPNQFNKAIGLEIDGFGSYLDYLESDSVEVLTFKGDHYNKETGELYLNQEIIVLDRTFVLYNGANDSWLGNGDILSASWRRRPDNLYGMGPLENIVGMQYRIDHLENLKADALDLSIHPPLVVKGDVENFVWAPEEIIRIIEDGEVKELGMNFGNVITANNEIERLATLMEEMAGAPKQALGIRTPGEKTMYEVQSLENGYGRLFQEKSTNLEINVMEPLMNLMLAVGRQHWTEGPLSVRALNDEHGVETFINITPEDLVASGTLRPVGARHFAEQAQLVQNLTQLMASPLGQMIQPHWSAQRTAQVVADSMNLDRFKLVQKNVGLTEQAETAEMQNNLTKVVAERTEAGT